MGRSEQSLLWVDSSWLGEISWPGWVQRACRQAHLLESCLCGGLALRAKTDVTHTWPATRNGGLAETSQSHTTL